ncbi:MAG: glycosyltransferase family 2 protein [Rubritepida sp.]|nr:glycosyltransferase family 2 protein [Rubritepida sp.]
MSDAPRLSVVIPVKNEAGNIAPLVAEIEAALTGRIAFEILYVDDGSTDATRAEVTALQPDHPALRLVVLARNAGKAEAQRAGVRAARGALIVLMDGDGQNDPAEIPRLLAALEAAPRAGLAMAQRLGRKDTAFKRWQSRTANRVRQWLLADGARDTGCGFALLPREVYLALPAFDGLHRFLPVLVKREGHELVFVDVTDRPRRAGSSKYGFFDRLWVGIADMLGVLWLVRRRRGRAEVAEER